MYYNHFINQDYNSNRQFFVPFLLGGLAGSAVVGLSRPRPVYVQGPQYQRPPYPYYPPYTPSSYYSYQSGGYY